MFEDLKFLNVGAPLFRAELEKQHVDCAQVDWKPVAGGNQKVIAALDRLLEQPEREAANAEAAARIKRSRAVWVGMPRSCTPARPLLMRTCAVPCRARCRAR